MRRLMSVTEKEDEELFLKLLEASAITSDHLHNKIGAEYYGCQILNM